MNKNKFIFRLLPFLLLLTGNISAQKDSVSAKELVKLKYFNNNNSVQFLVLENLSKTGKKTDPLKNKVFQLYLDSNKTENLIAIVTTDMNGRAKSFLPPSLKANWEASPSHTFIAVAVGKEESATVLEIVKAKINIDTVSVEGVRSIKVQVLKYDNAEWIPVNEVEMKIGIQRLGGILSAGSEETYTTDSSGTVNVELNKDSIPGDQKGNIILVAKVEDNELLGSLLVEKKVPWGIAVKPSNSFFDQRTLWATRFRTPLWLLFMAYSIVIAVWATIIYLVTVVVKIKKLGNEYERSR